MLRRCGLRLRSNALRDAAAAQLKAIDEAGTTKIERVIVTPQQSHISVESPAGGVVKTINFCANNYLGLSNHPETVAAAKASLDERGFGLSSVRFICGTMDIHKRLEGQITDYLKTEDTILYPSCFDANAGVFETVLTEDDAVISDALNHASIIDGIRLCKAERHRYAHMNMVELEEILVKTQGKRIRLIVTDGVFSMDGDVAPLGQIAALADQYNANIFVDDCHASGIMGKTGRGSAELFGLEGRIDIINSTLGKALGGASGGFSSGCKEIVALQRQKGRPYLFSNSIAPPVVAGTIKAMEMLSVGENPQLAQLQANTALFRKEMTAAGFVISGHETCPIAPVMLGDARLAASMADEMLKHGIYVIGFSFPVVPKGQARIRVQLSAAHSEDDVRQCIDAFKTCKKVFKL